MHIDTHTSTHRAISALLVRVYRYVRQHLASRAYSLGTLLLSDLLPSGGASIHIDTHVSTHRAISALLVREHRYVRQHLASRAYSLGTLLLSDLLPSGGAYRIHTYIHIYPHTELSVPNLFVCTGT